MYMYTYPFQIEASPSEKAVAGLRLFWDAIFAKIIDFMWISHRRSIQLYDGRDASISRSPCE